MFNIITVEHFKDNIQQYGNHKEMLRSLKSIRYCKLEAYSDSLEGILRIPKKKTAGNLWYASDFICRKTP